MTLLFHITQRNQWQQAQITGTYWSETFASEGFIHCSSRSQVIQVANRFFRAQPDLVLLCIQSDRVQSEIRYEAVDLENYPHIYGALNLDAVIQVVDFVPDANGCFSQDNLAQIV